MIEIARWLALSLCCVACEGSSRWILQRADDSPADVVAPSADASIDAQAAFDAGEVTDARAAELPDADAFSDACSPDITVDNLTASGNGALFDRAFPEPERALVEIAKRVCSLLYKDPREVPASPPIVLVIDDYFGIGAISITAPVIYIRLSSLHMQSAAAEGKDVRDEITADLHYLLAIDYELDNENPSAVRWVLEGIAAWVRYRAGYTSPSERRPGGSPIDDATIAGFFFDWLDRTHPDAVYELNQSLDPTDGIAWSEEVFEIITGKDLSALWAEYQATL